jgi:hypothetical protein
MDGVTGEFGKLFRAWSEGLFGGGLPQPTFIFMPERKPVFAIANDGRNVVVGKDILRVTKSEVLSERLLHVMVHLANAQAGRRDCTSNEYHNNHFADAAMHAGLFVSRHHSKGWEVTSLSERVPSGVSLFSNDRVKVRERVLSRSPITAELLAEARRTMREISAGTGTPKQCFLKYTCGCPEPHNSIRSGRRPDGRHPLKAVCSVCGEEFKCVGR